MSVKKARKMRKTLLNIGVGVLLLSALSACDKPADKPAPQPDKPPLQVAAPPAEPPAAPEPAAPEPPPGYKVTLQKGRIAFTLSENFTDQTAQSGAPDSGADSTHLFINSQSRQLVVFSLVAPAAGQTLKNDSKGLDALGDEIFTGLSSQYQHIKQLQKQSINVGKLPVRRMDNELRVNGQMVDSTLLYTVWHKKVLTLQINTPASRGDEHAALLDRILTTLVLR
ncbi:DUF1795 domain-containing protein [Affinibrenneria salicis]|uniref:DUF1795 domain-containing protein n=1 Tax=Affinibrenneria salicis TaxID=2590031 RepID=A0A5J5FUJ0_9GAMM|nr:DcrB-related protein [Affinibrenneria salicis]KAA8997344.1 DUF1795 domain-containing protein [Affinibrenneria salicis]